MADSQEKQLLKQDTVRTLTDLGAKGTLICHFEIPGHRLLGMNEILRKSLKGRLGQKRKEKKQIQQGFDTSCSSSPTGLDLSTHLTRLQEVNGLKTTSSKKSSCPTTPSSSAPDPPSSSKSSSQAKNNEPKSSSSS